MILPIFEYTVNTDNIEFKVGDITKTIPIALQLVKIDYVSKKVSVFTEDGNIVFSEKDLPINGFTTLVDLYNDLNQYVAPSGGGGGGSLPYKMYSLYVMQSGVGNLPSITDIYNDIETVTWAYDSIGTYIGTFTNPITGNIPPTSETDFIHSVLYSVVIEKLSSTEVRMTILDVLTGLPADDLIDKYLEIKMY